MTNFEKWKDEILKIEGLGYLAVVDGKPLNCRKIDCSVCDFKEQSDCERYILNWLYSEYKEPAPKLTKRDYHFLMVIKGGWIARDKYGELFWYEVKPRKSLYGGWNIPTDNNYNLASIIEDSFPFIKWEDEEPWKVEDLLKLEVEE